MRQLPPGIPEKLLRFAVGEDGVGQSIVGDLREDYVTLIRCHGPGRANRWYWREALTMSMSSVATRLIWRRRGRKSEGRYSAMEISSVRLGLRQDVRFAVRSLRKDAGFFALAVLIFGLGVGASTAVFSVMSPLMLRALPFADPDQLVWIPNTSGSGMSGVTSRPFNLRDFREMNQTFDGLTGYNAFFEQRSYNLIGDGPPVNLAGVGVAHDFLDVLGVQPLIGRGFSAEEGLWDGPAAVLLTYDLWTSRFDSDPQIVGRAITLNNSPWQVVGVLPRSFDFSSTFAPRTDVDLLLPFPISPETDQQGNTLSIIGRLKPEQTAQTAQADLDRVMTDLRAADPDRWGLNGVDVKPLQSHIAGPFRGALLLLTAASAAVMLIVCVNLANLLLARGAKRGKEIALRSVLGATRLRLVRQLLIESVTLSIAGAVVGVGLAVVATRLAAGTTGIEIPMLRTVTVDGVALLFTLLLALTAGLVTGIVPALQVSSGRESAALNNATRGGSAGKRSARLREALVISEVALACVLLVFGSLFLKSFRNVLDVDAGFQWEELTSWRLSATRSFESSTAAATYYDGLVNAVMVVPGVEAVGLTDALPFGRNRNWSARGQGVVYEENDFLGIYPHVVDWRYIETMRIPTIAGRRFTASDTEDSDRVVILNQTAAERLFLGEDAVGRRIDTWTDWLVVGVVQDVRHRSLEDEAGAEVYFLQRQYFSSITTVDLVVRSRLAAETLIPGVTAALRTADGALPTGDVETLQAVVDRSVSPRRFTLLVLGTFALTALILAALGVYGVLSYSVAERIPEIGIRMALGESAMQVLVRVVGRTVTLASIGVFIGAAVCVVGTRFVRSLLFGVTPYDPLSFVVMAGVLLGVAALAGYLPAWRASRTDPVSSFRST